VGTIIKVDSIVKRSKDVDLGGTIYDDPQSVNVFMWVGFALIYPAQAREDLYIHLEGKMKIIFEALWKSLLSLLLIVCIIICGILITLFFSGYGSVFETNDVADYGTYVGNFDNETPAEFISSFFPESIESSFSDVIYHYKAKKGDTYAYEAYLEFVINDPEQFSSYIENNLDRNACYVFSYDPSYQVYVISEMLELHNEPEYQAQNAYPISRAKFGIALFSETEQKVIYFALGMYDGGGTTTAELNYFFDRFQIDPVVLEQNGV